MMAPTFTAPPGAVTVACDAVPAVSSLSFTNGAAVPCLISGMVTSTQTAHPGACGGMITETWTIPSATNCGRGDIVHTRAITVSPATAPTAAAVTNPGPLSCPAAEAFTTAPEATYTNGLTGDCEISGSFVGTVTGHPGACGGTITVSYTDAIDACGNTVTAPADVVITVNPMMAPSFTALPMDMAVQCIADIPAVSSLSFTNNATGSCEISGMVTSVQGALTGLSLIHISEPTRPY